VVIYVPLIKLIAPRAWGELISRAVSIYRGRNVAVEPAA
jgi:hypothetical protein